MTNIFFLVLFVFFHFTSIHFITVVVERKLFYGKRGEGNRGEIFFEEGIVTPEIQACLSIQYQYSTELLFFHQLINV